ncbi:hypothetical protein KFE25_012910 [Diacronema lutheri]|uniref:CTLH domain-containing protein n=1 Tax=Diacronema lutheri TaxID=2081491 RepID=A0A8J5X8Z5_DIALT|nr:hypothetical protein KFE25_012910 [Diacronema lutheri]
MDVVDWQQRMSEVAVDRVLVNRLVLDYLVIEGYKDAAEAFSRESGLSEQIDVASIADRMAIRAAVQRGDVQAAIDLVDALDPQILRANGTLAFHLRQQQLIEIIRSGAVDDALAFAQTTLAPAGEANPAFLDEIERTMALLAFEDTASCPVGHLLDPSHRHKTASELNGAILAAQSSQREPRLPICLRMLLWAQQDLADKHVVVPRVAPDQLVAAHPELDATKMRADEPPAAAAAAAARAPRARGGAAAGAASGVLAAAAAARAARVALTGASVPS